MQLPSSTATSSYSSSKGVIGPRGHPPSSSSSNFISAAHHLHVGTLGAYSKKYQELQQRRMTAMVRDQTNSRSNYYRRNPLPSSSSFTSHGSSAGSYHSDNFVATNHRLRRAFELKQQELKREEEQRRRRILEERREQRQKQIRSFKEALSNRTVANHNHNNLKTKKNSKKQQPQQMMPTLLHLSSSNSHNNNPAHDVHYTQSKAQEDKEKSIIVKTIKNRNAYKGGKRVQFIFDDNADNVKNQQQWQQQAGMMGDIGKSVSSKTGKGDRWGIRDNTKGDSLQGKTRPQSRSKQTGSNGEHNKNEYGMDPALETLLNDYQIPTESDSSDDNGKEGDEEEERARSRDSPSSYSNIKSHNDHANACDHYSFNDSRRTQQVQQNKSLPSEVDLQWRMQMSREHEEMVRSLSACSNHSNYDSKGGSEFTNVPVGQLKTLPPQCYGDKYESLRGVEEKKTFLREQNKQLKVRFASPISHSKEIEDRNNGASSQRTTGISSTASAGSGTAISPTTNASFTTSSVVKSRSWEQKKGTFRNDGSNVDKNNATRNYYSSKDEESDRDNDSFDQGNESAQLRRRSETGTGNGVRTEFKGTVVTNQSNLCHQEEDSELEDSLEIQRENHLTKEHLISSQEKSALSTGARHSKSFIPVPKRVIHADKDYFKKIMGSITENVEGDMDDNQSYSEIETTSNTSGNDINSAAYAKKFNVSRNNTARGQQAETEVETTYRPLSGKVRVTQSNSKSISYSNTPLGNSKKGDTSTKKKLIDAESSLAAVSQIKRVNMKNRKPFHSSPRRGKEMSTTSALPPPASPSSTMPISSSSSGPAAYQEAEGKMLNAYGIKDSSATGDDTASPLQLLTISMEEKQILMSLANLDLKLIKKGIAAESKLYGPDYVYREISNSQIKSSKHTQPSLSSSSSSSLYPSQPHRPISNTGRSSSNSARRLTSTHRKIQGPNPSPLLPPSHLRHPHPSHPSSSSPSSSSSSSARCRHSFLHLARPITDTDEIKRRRNMII
eukprot:Nk52_evm1s185 gene=Nk52_evmTU1s185